MANSEPENLDTAAPEKLNELFPYEMPFRAAHTIGLLIILLFLTVGVSSIVVKIPESIRCPFVLVPEGGSDPVQSPFQGVLREAYVIEGEQVRAEQLLFVIRSNEIHAWTTEMQTLKGDLRALELRRQSSVKAHKTRTETAQTEIAQHESEIDYQKKYLATYQDIGERMAELRRQGLASVTELLNHEVGLAGAERDVALAEQSHLKAQLQLRQLAIEHERELTDETIEFNKTTVRIRALQKQLKDCEGDVVFVRAPFDGTVLSVARKNEGDIVALGQELCQIARSDASPRAQLSVAEEGVPRLKPGQPVKLYFQAFPYQRHGTCDGTLKWVSPAPVASAGGAGFIAFVEPAQFTMKVAGEDFPLRIGMQGEARIQVGRRTLIEYAFAPLRQLRENMRGAQSGVDSDAEMTTD